MQIWWFRVNSKLFNSKVWLAADYFQSFQLFMIRLLQTNTRWKMLKVKRLTRKLNNITLAAFTFPAVLLSTLRHTNMKLKYLPKWNLCEHRQTIMNMRKRKPQNYNLVKWVGIIIYGFDNFNNRFNKFDEFEMFCGSILLVKLCVVKIVVDNEKFSWKQKLKVWN